MTSRIRMFIDRSRPVPQPSLSAFSGLRLSLIAHSLADPIRAVRPIPWPVLWSRSRLANLPRLFDASLEAELCSRGWQWSLRAGREKSMDCPFCGTVIKEGFHTCPSCGADQVKRNSLVGDLVGCIGFFGFFVFLAWWLINGDYRLRLVILGGGWLLCYRCLMWCFAKQNNAGYGDRWEKKRG